MIWLNRFAMFLAAVGGVGLAACVLHDLRWGEYGGALSANLLWLVLAVLALALGVHNERELRREE